MKNYWSKLCLLYIFRLQRYRKH